MVVKGKKIAPIVFRPDDFLGRRALIHGKAVNRDGRAWLTGPQWQVEVLRGGQWPQSLCNAPLAITGTIGKEPDAIYPFIKDCRVQRDGLDAQLDQRVALRGEAREFNRRWYLRYNCQRVLVEDMDRLAVAHALDLNTPIEVRGLLRKEWIRDEILDCDSHGPTQQYIVREASCTVVDDLLPIERVEEPCPWSVGAATDREPYDDQTADRRRPGRRP